MNNTNNETAFYNTDTNTEVIGRPRESGRITWSGHLSNLTRGYYAHTSLEGSIIT